MSTLANNKRSCSKKWGHFSCFSGENFGTILSRRSRLSRTSRAPSLDGKNVFQCFWSDPQTRVFECFWVSLCILDGKNAFQCFWSDPKTRVFECFSEVLYCFCHLGLPPESRLIRPRPIGRSVAILDGKNVFQSFWSDPQTRVFKCFWVSLCILYMVKIFFSAFLVRPQN